jgi:hypothetical protein
MKALAVGKQMLHRIDALGQGFDTFFERFDELIGAGLKPILPLVTQTRDPFEKPYYRCETTSSAAAQGKKSPELLYKGKGHKCLRSRLHVIAHSGLPRPLAFSPSCCCAHASGELGEGERVSYGR